MLSKSQASERKKT